MMLRIQLERKGGRTFPGRASTSSSSGSRASGCALAKPECIVMHPGPMNRGVEIAPRSPTDRARSSCSR